MLDIVLEICKISSSLVIPKWCCEKEKKKVVPNLEFKIFLLNISQTYFMLEYYQCIKFHNINNKINSWLPIFLKNKITNIGVWDIWKWEYKIELMIKVAKGRIGKKSIQLN